MEVGIYKGAMYVRLNQNEELELTPIILGDGILKVGDCVRRLGEKKRSQFEIEDGYLRYKGKFDNTLFFDTGTDIDEHQWHYGFYHIDKNTLLVSSNNGMWDIRINHLEKI